MQRIIGHLDMDAFFASVEERDSEWLRGKPLVVGADPKDGRGRGVVSTANYKAREYGISSATPISKAWQLSEAARKAGKEPAVFLLTNFRKYSEASENIFHIVRERISLIEEASVDEAYLDLSFTGSYGEAKAAGRQLKKEILEKEGLTCSIGIGPNKLIAKIASDLQKPDGLTVIEEKEVEKFLEPLAVRKMPGIGPKTETELLKIGVRTVKDLKRFSLEEMRDNFGKWGSELYFKIRGLDDSPVTEDYEIKSVGEQETFEVDSRDPQFIIERLNLLSEGVMQRFRQDGFSAYKRVVLTVRFSDFQTLSRSKSLPESASTAERLKFETMRLLMPFLESGKNQRSIRLVGVRVEGLQS